MTKKPKAVETEVISYTKEGLGLGYVEQEIGAPLGVAIPFAVVGDRVKGVVYRKRKGLYQVHEEEVVTPSLVRATPKCSHVGVCGGCKWQQLLYEEQLKEKESSIRRNFIDLIDVSKIVHPIVPCSSPWKYRNKMEFSFSQNKAGEKFLGLFMAMSRGRVLNLQECHLVNPWMVEALTKVRLWWEKNSLSAYHPPSNRGTLRTLTLREGIRSGDRMAILTVSGNPEFAIKRSEIDSFIQAITEILTPEIPGSTLSFFLRVHQAIKGRPTEIYEMHLLGSEWIREKISLTYLGEKEFEFHISPQAFFQPNTIQAERLYNLAVEMASPNKKTIVYDLFCGTGTLGICAAPFSGEVIGIELSHDAVLDARFNASHNALENTTFYQGDVATVLKQLSNKGELKSADIVFVDPPRSGLGLDALEQVLSLSPEKIVYVSCNAKTQAEDCKILAQQGYHIDKMYPVDQFPHTIHCETVALLTKEKRHDL